MGNVTRKRTYKKSISEFSIFNKSSKNIKKNLCYHVTHKGNLNYFSDDLSCTELDKSHYPIKHSGYHVWNNCVGNHCEIKYNCCGKNIILCGDCLHYNNVNFNKYFKCNIFCNSNIILRDIFDCHYEK